MHSTEMIGSPGKDNLVDDILATVQQNGWLDENDTAGKCFVPAPPIFTHV